MTICMPDVGIAKFFKWRFVNYVVHQFKGSKMEKIIFGGAMLSVFMVLFVFIASLTNFLYKWILDILENFKKDFKKGFKHGMESD